MDERVSQISSVLGNAPFGVVVLNAEGRIIYTNPQFNSAVDSEGMPVTGRSIYNLIPELLWDYSVINNIKRLIDTGKPFYTVVETLSSKGIKGADFVNINGYKQDDTYILITTIESGSFKKETRYKKVIQVAPDSIIIMRKGVITFCNPAFAGIIDLPYASIVGREIFEFVSDKDIETLSPLKDDQIREFNATIEVMTSKGRKILGGKFHPIEESPGMTMAILRDVTEKVALEKRLLRQNQDLSVINLISETLSSSLEVEKMLHKTLDKVLEVMGIEAGWIYFLNEKENILECVCYSGISEEIARHIDSLKVGEGLAGSVASTGRPIIIENVSDDPRLTRFVLKEKGMRSFASIPLKSRTRLIGVMDIASYGSREFSQDDRYLLTSIGLHMGMVTENALLFKEVADTSKRLRNAIKIIKERNLELRNLISTVSHDLKSPLIAINGFMKRLMKSARPKLNDKELEYVEAIMDSGRRMEKFVANLLAFSSVGRHRVKREKVSLQEVLDGIIRDVAQQLEEKNGKIILADDMPEEIETDKTSLIQVFSNLLTNAIKYSSPKRDLVIRINYGLKDNMHVFSVSDNGMGIPSRHADAVFDLFFRTYENVAEGDGLGLSIAKKAVNSMGGDIWLESVEGQGSTFYFSIPLEEAGEGALQ